MKPKIRRYFDKFTDLLDQQRFKFEQRELERKPMIEVSKRLAAAHEDAGLHIKSYYYDTDASAALTVLNLNSIYGKTHCQHCRKIIPWLEASRHNDTCQSNPWNWKDPYPDVCWFPCNHNHCQLVRNTYDAAK